MGRGRVALVAAVVAALVAAGCSGSGTAAGDRDGDRRLRVVATTTQVADLAANVGGDRVRVTGLLKPGIDPHDYEPSPADIDAIAHADLVLENGVGLEAWLGDTIDGSGFDGPVVDTSQGVRLRMVEGAPDPHIWQDPGNAERMAANIERGLAAAEPSAAGAFRANLAAYTKDLRALDAEVQRQVDSLANRKVVTDHDAFGYYIERYGLDNHGLIAKIKNPYDGNSSVIVVAGVRSAGTKSAVIALTNYSEEVLRRYNGEEDWALVVQGFDMNSDGKIDHVDVVSL